MAGSNTSRSSGGRRSNDGSTVSEELESLVTLAARGERRAQDELLQRHWPLIRMVVRARRARLPATVRARDETRDLEQGAALKVLLGLERHAWRGRSAFLAWVKTLAEHEVVDAVRRSRAQRRDAQAEVVYDEAVPVATPRRSAESVVDDARGITRLVADLELLKAEQAAALLMHHLGFTHGEIGEAVGVSEEAARKLVSRARLKLLDLRRR